MTRIELPDYLPSQFKNWLDFYYEIKNKGYDQMETIELSIWDDTKIEWRSQFNEDVDFYHKFPMWVVRERALNHLLTKLPDFDSMINLIDSYLSSRQNMGEIMENKEILDKILSICERKRN